MIVIPDDAPPVMSLSHAVGRLRGCEHRLYSTLPSGPLELVARILGADAVINIRASTRFTAEVLAECRHLRLISIWGTGTDLPNGGGRSMGAFYFRNRHLFSSW